MRDGITSSACAMFHEHLKGTHQTSVQICTWHPARECRKSLNRWAWHSPHPNSDATCGFTGVGNMQNTDPMLQPLQDNGGLTKTHALNPTSPVIDAADPSSMEFHDQRGFERPADGDTNGSLVCDIGAFEHAALPPIFYDGFEGGGSFAWSN
jgi:hypothetical protein